jgi:LytR cell envelope-related transcriptional attenuator
MTAIAHAPRLGATILRTAARGAVLVGAAVVVGIVLLQIVNGSPSGGGGATASSTPSSSSSSSGTTATTNVNSGRPAAQVKIFVQNASGVGGAAATRANVLRGLGYAIVGTGNALTPLTGTTVGCKTGFTKEADTLAKAVGVGTTVGAFPTPAPANATSADCVVTIGK